MFEKEDNEMKDYKDGSWLENNVWGKWGNDDEVGALNEVGPKDVLSAVSYNKNVNENRY